jgi:hypothetical protein
MIADTLSMARAIDGPDAGNSLAKLAERHGLGVKGTEVVNALGKGRLDFTTEELARYGEYCINDVELTYALFKKLAVGFPPAEARLIARHAGAATGQEAEPLAVLQGLGLSTAGAATLLSHMTEEHFEAGQTVIRTGERSDSVRILIAGTADVCLPPEPGSPPFKLATFSPGTIFGEMALLTGAPRQVFATLKVGF